ncbi:hypothetical protein GCM10009555_036550 [Acrocarpospora macrocephala]|uniref:Uncharacterized protein n=1 Tax=Acrocarpospora macrocephala TaxID=150177 RepID=A0A5M3WXT9_9ACTN|nr:hypothetical protein [Acrocarpospora macrocephala]GES13216.1 hypothetical protein Amac_068130 [Acrocarpospora macrocephala]
MISEIDEWRAELVELGAIVQDDDNSVPVDVAEARFNRYTELVGMVDRAEGPPVVDALISSMRAEQDYGAYQATHGALALFPVADLGRGTAMAAPSLVEIPRDHGGEVLAAVAGHQDSVREFNSVTSRFDSDLRARLTEMISQEEQDGWLSDGDLAGRLRP